MISRLTESSAFWKSSSSSLLCIHFAVAASNLQSSSTTHSHSHAYNAWNWNHICIILFQKIQNNKRHSRYPSELAFDLSIHPSIHPSIVFVTDYDRIPNNCDFETARGRVRASCFTIAPNANVRDDSNNNNNNNYYYYYYYYYYNTTREWGHLARALCAGTTFSQADGQERERRQEKGEAVM